MNDETLDALPDDETPAPLPTSIRPLSFPALRDRSEWPAATCPDCGFTRPHPLGGEQICDDCRDDVEASIAAEQTRLDAGRAERLRTLPTLLRRAGCPPRYGAYTRASWEASFGAWPAGTVTAKLDGWTGEEPASWLVLFYGLYGRRKTSLATALLGERIVAGKKAQWWDAAEFGRQMQAGIRDESAQDLYAKLAGAEVLLLDDLGSVVGAREGRRAEQTWWCEQLALLLRHREAYIKPTIVTANVESIGELARIDQSLVFRMDVPLAFKLAGKNYRGAP